MLWDACHTGFSGSCVSPPRSRTDYARFHSFIRPVADGGQVVVGQLTFGVGHAPQDCDGTEARAHYRSGRVGADVRAVDGRFRIWCTGAARPDLSDADLREPMASPPSGDWRRFGNSLEMIGVLAVNVPGFNTPRVHKRHGLVASLIAPAATARRLTRADAAAIADRIAASIGRSRANESRRCAHVCTRTADRHRDV